MAGVVFGAGMTLTEARDDRAYATLVEAREGVVAAMPASLAEPHPAIRARLAITNG